MNAVSSLIKERMEWCDCPVFLFSRGAVTGVFYFFLVFLENGGFGFLLFFWGGVFFCENYLFLRHDMRVVAKAFNSWDLETVIALTGG